MYIILLELPTAASKSTLSCRNLLEPLIYTRKELLRLSKSPLVFKPKNL